MRNAMVPEDGKYTLTLFGDRHPEFFVDNHGKTLEKPFLVSITVTDLLTDDEFDMNDPYDVIMRLSKSDVIGAGDFIAAAGLVMSSKTKSDARKKLLMTQIALLASGKPDVGDAIVQHLIDGYPAFAGVFGRLKQASFDEDLAQRHRLGGDDGMLVGQFRMIRMLEAQSFGSESKGIMSFHNLASFDAAYHDIRNWYFNEKNFEMGRVEAKIEAIGAMLSASGREFAEVSGGERMSLDELDAFTNKVIKALQSDKWTEIDRILAERHGPSVIQG
jgi:hypothetical protein